VGADKTCGACDENVAEGKAIFCQSGLITPASGGTHRGVDDIMLQFDVDSVWDTTLHALLPIYRELCPTSYRS
jgi:hypothetical protein